MSPKKNIFKYSFYLLIFFCGLPAISQDNVLLESYNHGEGIRFSQGDDYNFRIRGWIQPFFQSISYLGDNEIGNIDRYRLRRARINFEGNPGNQRFYYRLQFDLTGNGPERYGAPKKYLLDAFVRYNISKQFRVTFGQRMPKTDNREVWMRSNSLQFVERSMLTSDFSSLREFGILFRGNFRTSRGGYIRSYLSIQMETERTYLKLPEAETKLEEELTFYHLELFQILVNGVRLM